METTIGVFSSRERAEEAVEELVTQKVPKESIVFLTLSEAEAKKVLRLLEAIDDHDDVQAVHSNADISDEVLAAFEG